MSLLQRHEPPGGAAPGDAEARLQRVLEDMTEGVAESTLDGRIVAVNGAFARMLGCASAEELVAKVPDVSVLYADPAQRHALVRRALKTDGTCRADVEVQTCDGRRIWLRGKYRARRGPDGRAVGILIVAEDITESRDAEARTRETEERLHFAFQDNPLPLLVVELTNRGALVTEANTALERLLGYGPGSLVGVDAESLVHDDDLSREHSAFERSGPSGLVELETRRRHRAGYWIPVALRGTKIRGANGRVYVIAALTDLSARHAAEQARVATLALVEARANADEALADLSRLTLQSEDLAALARTACGLVVRVLEVDFCSILVPDQDRDGFFGLLAQWGWDRRILATTDTAAGPDSQVAYCAANGAPVIVDDWRSERRFVAPKVVAAHGARSGMSVPVRHDRRTIGVMSVQNREVRRFDDAALGFLGSVAQLVGIAIVQDRVRRRLSRSERTLQSIVDNAPVAIHVLDHEGRFLVVNRELERLIGMPRDLLMGRTREQVPALRDGAHLEGLVDGIEALRREAPLSGEHSAALPDGVHSYLTVDFPLIDLDRNTYGVGSISTDVTEIVRSRAEMRDAWLGSMHRLARAVEARDGATGAHVERMAAYAELAARLLGLPEERCEQIRLASTLHDVGKIAIPDRVLLKRGTFTAKERKVMQTHADIGYRLLTGAGSDLLELAATIAHSHHERFDGGGYPQGQRGHEIPLEGRIAAVADAFDAMTSDRVYRAALSIDGAVQEMRDDAGHFDPEVLDAFVRGIDLVRGIWLLHHPATRAVTSNGAASTNGAPAAGVAAATRVSCGRDGGELILDAPGAADGAESPDTGGNTETTG